MQIATPIPHRMQPLYEMPIYNRDIVLQVYQHTVEQRSNTDASFLAKAMGRGSSSGKPPSPEESPLVRCGSTETTVLELRRGRTVPLEARVAELPIGPMVPLH